MNTLPSSSGPIKRGTTPHRYSITLAAMANEGTHFECISAVTVFTADMARAVRFYEALGMVLCYGGPDAPFSSFRFGSSFVNVAAGTPPATLWGRAILYVSDVDAMYARVLAAGYTTSTRPADATWGERYFHVRDPDGNEWSFARPLAQEGAA